MYPMFLNAYLEEKPWGGNVLRDDFGKSSASAGPLGESWEASAMPDKESIIRNGKYAGMPLSQVYAEHPDLFGTDAAPYFPLLIKLIDAKDWLSVQVHSGESKIGIFKTEAWYILSAEENAQLAFGWELKSKAELREAIASGTLTEHLEYVPVKPGDVFYIPPGTLHAIGAGIVLYEIQTPSNVTYRLHQFLGARTIHIEKGVEAYDSRAKYRKEAPKKLGEGIQLLLECDFFELEQIDADSSRKQTSTNRFFIYTAFGDGCLTRGDESFSYVRGDSFIVPAGYGKYEVHGGMLLKAYMPEIFTEE